MLVKIKCPECATEGTISLLEASYEGPYKCWKCRQLFYVTLKNSAMQSHRLLSQEEFEKIQEVESLKKKYKRD